MNTAATQANQRLALQYFDGRQARAEEVLALLDAQGKLHLTLPDGSQLQYAVRSVRWPERQRHGQRQALLPDGGLLSGADARAWDAWVATGGVTESWVVRWTQSWRHVALTLMIIGLIFAGLWRWGIPWAGDQAAALMPTAVVQELGARTLAQLDGRWLQPSELSEAERQDIRAKLSQAVRAAAPQLGQPEFRLHFRRGDKAIGPNAFALPGGDVVLTDELVDLMEDQPEAVIGVLGHELGHVQHQHGLRMAMRASLVTLVSGVVVGDFSTLLAGMPAVLMQNGYSRDFEREADAHAKALLLAAGIPPSTMVLFFDRLSQHHPGPGAVGSIFATHPANDERRRFFSE